MLYKTFKSKFIRRFFQKFGRVKFSHETISSFFLRIRFNGNIDVGDEFLILLSMVTDVGDS